MAHRLLILLICGLLPATASAQLSQVGKGYELDKLPEVAKDFKVKLWAKEPTLLHPASLTFDRKGRMYVGHGPQFRKPSLQTGVDSILMLEDKDGDGIAAFKRSPGKAMICGWPTAPTSPSSETKTATAWPMNTNWSSPASGTCATACTVSIGHPMASFTCRRATVEHKNMHLRRFEI